MLAITPQSARIGRDARVIATQLRQLRAIHATLTPQIVIDGPSQHGIDALDAFGGIDELRGVIDSWQHAYDMLCDRCLDAQIEECRAEIPHTSGAERARLVDYLSDLLCEQQETRGTRRAA